MRTKLIACGLLIAGAVAVSGQSQRQPATLDDLVMEIRALRADLKASAAATTRTQMLTARLQLQEQRIAVLANQRSDVMARLAVETRLRADAQGQVQRFEEMKGGNESVGIPRAELEGMLAEHRRTFGQHRDAEQQLRSQESDLSAQIAAEQNRWQDFNNRLDELERSLK
jgi:chromosome segregation ATPase